MWISKAGNSFEKTVIQLCKWLNYFGAAMLAIMMFLTGADVIMRYVFNRPITGTGDLIPYSMAVLISFGMAYSAIKKRHISVDIVFNRLPQRIREVMQEIIWLVSLTFFSSITWQCTVYLKETFDSGLVSAVLRIPAFPFVAAVALGSAIYCLVLLMEFLGFMSHEVRRLHK